MAFVPRKDSHQTAESKPSIYRLTEASLSLDPVFCAPSQYSEGTEEIARLYISVFAWHSCPLIEFTGYGCAGPRSSVGNMSDCKSRGPKFNPCPGPYFHGD